MLPIPLFRARHRALFVISFCVAFLAFAAVGTVNQRASVSVSTGSFLPEKGGITPEVNIITVNSTADAANGTDGLCTLREAIIAAHSNVVSGAATGECLAGSSLYSDTIVFSVTGTINLTQPLPTLNSNLAINGPGPSQMTIRRDTGSYRIFLISGATSPSQELPCQTALPLEVSRGTAAGLFGMITPP